MRLADFRSLPLFVAILAGGFCSSVALAQESPSSINDRVRFDQKLGAWIPLNAVFHNEAGQAVTLNECFKERPVILSLVYYNCPLLCTQVLNSLTRSLKPLSMNIGKDFDVITVSIAPDETPSLAAAKKAAYLERYDRPDNIAATEAGWHFLTGDTPSIEALAESIGFRYAYNPRTNLYTHAAGIVVLSPKGQITRYFFGLDYPVRDIQYGLREAESGRVGTPVSRVLLLCYDYDAATGTYTLSIVRLLRVAGTVTALCVAVFMLLMFRRDRRDATASQAAVASVGEANVSIS